MLTAGAVTCIITFIEQYTMVEKLVALFVVLLVFYVLGSILKWTLDFFEKQNEERLREEGEVIEKDSENIENAEGAEQDERP